MFEALQFSVMKDGVYFIDVSRGVIVDTDALTAALRKAKIRAAGLDVVDPEPLPNDNPLWSMSNGTITPPNSRRYPIAGPNNIKRRLTTTWPALCLIARYGIFSISKKGIRTYLETYLGYRSILLSFPPKDRLRFSRPPPGKNRYS